MTHGHQLQVQEIQLLEKAKETKARIQRYEKALKTEIKRFGFMNDGAGKRYLLGALYLKLGDVKGALRSYKWLAEALPDDSGEPFDLLCWSLALYLGGDPEAGTRKLLQTMLSNLYLLPALLGIEQNQLDIWHSSNFSEKSYLQYAPDEVFTLWDATSLDWARQIYTSPQFQKIRDRYIAIYKQLLTEPVGPKRNRLVDEAFKLETM